MWLLIVGGIVLFTLVMCCYWLLCFLLSNLWVVTLSSLALPQLLLSAQRARLRNSTVSLVWYTVVLLTCLIGVIYGIYVHPSWQHFGAWLKVNACCAVVSIVILLFRGWRPWKT